MRCMFAALALVVGTVLVLGTHDSARAGCCGDGGGYGFGFNGYYANRYYPSDRRIPYFAEHPPVYYSYPVPRTYGYSPYASPPTRTMPEVRVEPVIIQNPYIEAEPTSVVQPDRSAAVDRGPRPLVVLNPYVQQGTALAGQP